MCNVSILGIGYKVNFDKAIPHAVSTFNELCPSFKFLSYEPRYIIKYMYEAIKEFGQNFLSDSVIINKMVGLLEMTHGDTIIEIGPGHGALTEEVASRLRSTNSELYAVEIDKRFSDKLLSMYSSDENIHIYEDNILNFLPKFKTDKDVKILGSLPYYITSPIIHEIIKMNKQPELCVLLIQKEVAEKIASPAPDSSYLSVFVQTFYSVEYIFTVPKEKFFPKPQVDGGVLKLIKRKDVSLSEDIEKYEGFLHRGFSSPRKMLNKPFKREELALAGINPDLRPQNLSADEWLRFYLALRG